MPDNNHPLAIANRTLAFLAKLSRQQKMLLFENGTENALRVETVFQKIQPALYLQAGGEVSIGPHRMKQVRLADAANANPNDEAVLLGADSPFLRLVNSDAGNQSQTILIQKLGGEEFNKLVNNLDMLAKFFSTHFPRSLYVLGREYAFLHAKGLEPRLNQGYDPARWQNALAESPELGEAIVEWLSCIPEDESQVRVRLTACMDGLNLEQYERQSYREGLESCRRFLIKQENADPTYLKLLNQKVDGKDIFPWLSNYPCEPAYYVSGVKAGNEKFLTYHAVFLRCSREVQQFIRTPQLHSFVYCWLVSKYHAYDTAAASQTEAVAEQFKRGVQLKGEQDRPGRVSGLTAERQQKMAEWFREGKPILTEVQKNVLGEDHFYQDAKSALIRSQIETYQPPWQYDRGTLREYLENLWIKLCQTLGGPVAAIQTRIDELRKKIREFNNTVIGASVNGAAPHTLDAENFVGRLRESDPNGGACWQPFLDVAGSPETTGEQLHKAWTKALGVREQTEHATLWFDNRKEIDKERVTLRDLYRLRCRLLNRNRDDKQALLSNVIYTSEIEEIGAQRIPRSDSGKAKARTRIETLKEEAVAAAVARPVVVPKNDQTEARKSDGTLRENQPVSVYEETDLSKPVGTLTLTAEELRLDLLRPTPSELVIQPPAMQPPIKITTLGIPGRLFAQQIVDELEFWGRTVTSELNLVDELKILTQNQDLLKTKYVTAELGPQTSAMQRQLRTLLLGEGIDGVPRLNSHLGKPDLSNMYGLLLQLMEHLGKPEDQTLYDNTALRPGHPGLDEINISLAYPVADFTQLSTVLTYHHGICTKVLGLKDQLDDVQDLYDTVTAMEKTDSRLVIVDATLAQHAAIQTLETFQPTQHPSVLLYIGRTSAANSGLLAFGNSLRGAAANALGGTTQVPILVSPEKLAPVAGGSLAVIDQTTLFLPNLADSPPVNVTAHETTIILDDPESKGRLLIRTPQLALALSLGVLNAQCGNLTKRSFADWSKYDLTNHLNENGMSWRDDLPLRLLLRPLWFNHPDLVAKLIFSRWLSLVLHVRSTHPEMPRVTFGKHLSNWRIQNEEAGFENDFVAAFGGMSEIGPMNRDTIRVDGHPITAAEMRPAIPITLNFGLSNASIQQPSFPKEAIKWRTPWGLKPLNL